MQFTLADRAIRIFTISPRTLDKVDYWRNIRNVIKWSEKYGCTGVLLFEGNDTYINPWLVAHAAIIETDNLSPLIAVNPIYMHPFTAAKLVASFALMYKRKVYLNMITGTALSYLDSLDGHLTHDDRYCRLREYMHIIRSLLGSPTPLTWSGQFYRVSDLQLQPTTPAPLLPDFLLAGQSDAAHEIAREFGAIGLQMLQPGFERDLGAERAIHFGVTTRVTEAEAWEVANSLFPENAEDQMMLDLSMTNTDSVWKRRMRLAADEPDRADTGYWLQPFRNFKADCPYVVGTYERISDVLVRLIRAGIDIFVLDMPAFEEEFQHVHRAFKMAQKALTGTTGSEPRRLATE